MVIGHLRPVILMPVGLLPGLPIGQIELILLHELAHIRRYDYLVNLLQTSVEESVILSPGGVVDLRRDPRRTRTLLRRLAVALVTTRTNTPRSGSFGKTPGRGHGSRLWPRQEEIW